MGGSISRRHPRLVAVPVTEQAVAVAQPVTELAVAQPVTEQAAAAVDSPPPAPSNEECAIVGAYFTAAAAVEAAAEPATAELERFTELVYKATPAHARPRFNGFRVVFFERGSVLRTAVALGPGCIELLRSDRIVVVRNSAGAGNSVQLTLPLRPAPGQELFIKLLRSTGACAIWGHGNAPLLNTAGHRVQLHELQQAGDLLHLVWAGSGLRAWVQL